MRLNHKTFQAPCYLQASVANRGTPVCHDASTISTKYPQLLNIKITREVKK